MSEQKASQFAIVVDSGCDMPNSFYAKHQVILVPFHVRLGQEDYLDVPEEMPEDFYVRFSSKRERVCTSQPSLAEFEEVYQKLIDEGYTKIISLHMSSELSGSYQTALNAASVFENSDVEIAVIDTKLASAAEGILVADLVAMRDDNCSFEDALSHVSRLIALIKLFFVPTQKIALSNKKKFERGLFTRIHRLRDDIFGTRFLDQIDENGAVSTVVSAADLSAASAHLARLMSKESQYLGHLAYVEIHSGTPRALTFIEKPLDTNEFSSHCAGVIEVSPSIACHAGAGSVGLVYVPQDALYNHEFTAKEAWNN